MIPGSTKTTCRHIPLDIIEKILLKLPAKSIIRFRCVCKTFGDLSKSWPFAALHLAQTGYQSVVRISFNPNWQKVNSVGYHKCEKPTPEVVLYSKALTSKKGQFIFEDALESTSNDHGVFKVGERASCSRFEFIGNCNGIVCITDFTDIFLINPSLNEMKKITAPPTEVGQRYNICGLGFDHLSNNLKVVIILESWSKKERGQVYNLSTNSWTEVCETPTEMLPKNDSSVSFNGVIHWCVRIKESECEMLTFNTTTESFQLMNLPKGYMVTAEPSLLLLNQRLLAFASTGPQSIYGIRLFVDIWVMKEYGVEESWAKLYSIGPLGNIIQPISFWEEDKLLLWTKNQKLVLLDMRKRQALGSIDLPGKPPSGYRKSYDHCLGCIVCKESLISFSGN